MTDIQLSDSSVSSGAITLRGAEINYSWNNLIENDPIPSVFGTASDAQNEIQFMGWQNPQYKIRGFLDESSDAISSGMSLALLKSFAKSTGSTYVFDDVFSTAGTLVKIKSFNVRRMAAEKDDKIHQYDFTIIETQ